MNVELMNGTQIIFKTVILHEIPSKVVETEKISQTQALGHNDVKSQEKGVN